MKNRNCFGKQKGSKRAILFITDAAIAAFILLGAVIMLSTTDVGTGKKTVTTTAAADIVELLGELKVYEIQTDPFVSSLIANGNITDTNNTVLVQIGALWADNKISLAQNLTSVALQNALPANIDFEIHIDQDKIYEKNASYFTNNGTKLSVAKRLVSGITRGSPTEGFNARAYALSISKNNTLIVKGDVISSSVRKPSGGNNNNVVTEMYDAIIPDNATIMDAYWFIEAYYTDNKFKAYINGTFIPGSGGTGNVLLTGLKNYVKPGYNNLTVEYRYGAGGYEGGDDGASHFVAVYNTSEESTIVQSDKVYFSKVSSNTPIRTKKPVFVSGAVNTIDVSVNAKGTNATLGFMYQGSWYNISKKNITNGTVSWSDSEIKSNMSFRNVSYVNLSNEYFWMVLDIDDYKTKDTFGVARGIFANSYIQIGSSATLDPYGYIDVTQVVTNETHQSRQSGIFYRNVKWFYTLQPGAIFYKLDSQLAWLWIVSSGGPNQRASSNSKTLYDHPPQPFISEFARFGYTNSSGTIKAGANNYTLDFGSGYAVAPTYSLVDFTILIPGNVGYGATFANASLAQADAIQRLMTQLGPYIQAIKIVNQSVVLGGVPSMWGPALFEVRASQ